MQGLLDNLLPTANGELLQFNLYPNPAKNNVINNFIYDSNYTISIVDKSGRVTIKKITKEHIHNLDISNLQNGEYTIVISNGRFAKSKTFIKNN